MAKKIPYITTTDNPYDPADQFKQWLAFDMAHGYGTIELLGRLDTGGENQSPKDNEIAREQAIYEIALMNHTGNYTVVFKDDE